MKSLLTIKAYSTFFSQKDLNLRQTRWLEFLKDYDINFQYHSGKASIVPDVLSCRSYPTLSHLLALPRDLCKDFKKFGINAVTKRDKPILCAVEVQPTLIMEIRTAQGTNP